MYKISEMKKNELIPILQRYLDEPYFIQGTCATLKTDEDVDLLIKYIEENPHTNSDFISIKALELKMKRFGTLNDRQIK
jgi:hypothetical protein